MEITTSDVNLSEKSVAITVGSRGINCIVDVISLVVSFLKNRGALPFIVPAMGSHGGNTEKGKKDILSSLGITEQSINAPIKANVETSKTGNAKGIPVFCLKTVLSADAVVIINRIKGHTDFSGDIGSGLIKMAAVGLGGEAGARRVHLEGYSALCNSIKKIGLEQLNNLPILFGIGLLEDYNNNLYYAEVIKPGNFLQREKILFEKAKKLHLSLPVDDIDVLLIENFGKNICGTGMDPSVTGRYPSGYCTNPSIQRIVVLRLTPQSHGNASGIGMADITTAKFYESIDFGTFYKNIVTCGGFLSGKIPVVMPNDRQAIGVAIDSFPNKNITIIKIKNTSLLEKIQISATLKDRVSKKNYYVYDKPVFIQFDKLENIKEE